MSATLSGDSLDSLDSLSASGLPASDDAVDKESLLKYIENLYFWPRGNASDAEGVGLGVAGEEMGDALLSAGPFGGTLNASLEQSEQREYHTTKPTHTASQTCIAPQHLLYATQQYGLKTSKW